MSYEDMQHKHNKLDFSSKNQIEWLKPYTCIVKLAHAHFYTLKYAPEFAKCFRQTFRQKSSFPMFQNLRSHDAYWEIANVKLNQWQIQMGFREFAQTPPPQFF